MNSKPQTPMLDALNSPHDLHHMSHSELRNLADELRQEVISAVSETGGHLGAGLGVVELTVALHAVFDTPKDRLIWDVGHQCYPHKILTGRRDRIRSLRKEGGLSGFTKRAESPYDPFGAGHSSTSLSAALGFSVAKDLHMQADPPLGDGIAVIGDGAFTAGMVYEAMNHAGHLGQRMFVILNDNEMSIAPPVGAMSHYLNSLYRGPFQDFKSIAQNALEFLPEPFREGAKRTRGALKHIAQGGTLFEELGFHYVGPLDGHNIEELVESLRWVQAQADAPVLLHVLTKKGKGYDPAENAADRYHGVAKFDVETGKQHKPKSNIPSYTKIFAQTLTKLADDDERICAITAAMPDGTGLDIFAQSHKSRVFDVGIAEQHAVTFAGALAAGGARPFCAIYSTFLQRGYDQIVHDVAIQNLPVRFAIDRAGLVGADGPTHAGAFDIAYLSILPNMTVMAPADEAELEAMVRFAAQFDSGPIAFRYPRGEGVGLEIDDREIVLGQGREIAKGQGIAVLSLGTVLEEVQKAKEALQGEIDFAIYDARFAKPFDRDMVQKLAREFSAIITIEEGSSGGFGAQISHYLANEGLLDQGLKLRHMTLPDRYIDQASQEAMRAQAGLNAESIIFTIRALSE